MMTLLSHAWRSWRSAKGLGALAVVALAVGIGCATAIFTVVDAVLLRPLPYSQDSRWVAFFGGSTAAGESERYSALSLADLEDYRRRTRSFDVFGWYTLGGDFNMTSPGQPQHINGVEVTPWLVNNTGVNPAAGHLFNDSDGLNVALLSSRLWERLGGGREINGRSITLNNKPYRVIGVMPPWFALPIVSVSGRDDHNDVWIPVTPPSNEDQRRNAIYAAYARLKPGATLEQARADARQVASEIARESPSNHQAYTAFLFSLRDSVVKEIRPILFLLFGSAWLLLLITCANVAGLLVARSVGRARETAVRVALGGGQRQLAVQFFFEGLFVSLAAAALGVVVSIRLVRLLVSLATEYIPRSGEISLNWTVVAFALGVACLAAMLSALAPLWQAVRTQPNEVLSDGVRASAGARSRRLSHSLVVAEIALAFTLLSVSALLLSQLDNLNRTSPGFNADGLLTFELNISAVRNPPAKQLAAYQDRVLRELDAIPGVTGAALTNQVPLDGCCFSTTLFPEGVARSDSTQEISFMAVSPGYFRTLGIPLRRGRFLDEHDTNENIVPVLLDEAAEKRYWPNRNAIGAMGHIGAPDGSKVQVVGVVGNVRNEGLGQATRPEFYLLSAISTVNPMHFVVRTRLPMGAVIPAVRRAVQNVDPAQPIYAIRTMKEIIADSLTLQRIDSVVVSFFALAALLMAALGVYGVTSYSVRQRTLEIGTRMALGAIGRDLLRLILGDGLRMAVYGIGMGAVAAAGATWLLMRFFDVHDISAAPYLYAAGVTASLAALASLFPAWRATLVSPMVTIRGESDSIWTAARRRVGDAIRGPSGKERERALDSALLTEFIEASRRADSFSKALRMVLTTLCERIQTGSAMLFENASGQAYHLVAGVPGSDPTGYTIPAGGFLLNRLRFYTHPLAFTREDLNVSFNWASAQRLHYVAEIESLQQSGMCLAISLRTRNEIIGLLLLGAPEGRKQYSSSDKQFLKACAGQFALMLENAHLTDRVVEQENVRRDVALAAEVQKRLLPESSPDTAGSSFAAFTLPARSVGGDYYDFLDLGDRRIGIALADVAGKGIAAALIMAVVQASLRILAAEGKITLAELVTKMNRFLHQSTGSSSYATFFYAQVEEEGRRLRYINAGHNPPYLVRSVQNGSSEQVEELAAGGMIIGMFPSASYQESIVALQPGDVLLAFTDGVTEALNPRGEEFGEDRLKKLLCRLASLSLSEITSSIAHDLRKWIADAPQHDDLTFIVMKVN